MKAIISIAALAMAFPSVSARGLRRGSAVTIKDEPGLVQVRRTQDTGTIHACLLSSSGLIKIALPETVCDDGQTPLSWNIMGPVGK